MSLPEIAPYITGAGGALVVLFFFHILYLTGKIVTGREHENVINVYKGIASDKQKQIDDKDRQIDLYQRALERERNRAEAGTQAGEIAVSVLNALHKEIGR